MIIIIQNFRKVELSGPSLIFFLFLKQMPFCKTSQLIPHKLFSEMKLWSAMSIAALNLPVLLHCSFILCVFSSTQDTAANKSVGLNAKNMDTAALICKKANMEAFSSRKCCSFYLHRGNV